MEFKNFSLHVNQTKVARFVEELAAGRISATICRKCGRKFYPPRADCSSCMGSDMEWKALGGEGRLVTFTKIHVPPDHYAVEPPRMPFSSVQLTPCPIGIVEVEKGLRIMGWILKVDFQKIHIGMRMKCSPQLLPNGNITIVLEPIQ